MLKKAQLTMLYSQKGLFCVLHGSHTEFLQINCWIFLPLLLQDLPLLYTQFINTYCDLKLHQYKTKEGFNFVVNIIARNVLQLILLFIAMKLISGETLTKSFCYPTSSMDYCCRERRSVSSSLYLHGRVC